MSAPKVYVHAATSLQLSGWRYFFAFLKASRRAENRLKRTPGHVKYGLRANPFRLVFRTYSIYENYEDLQNFLYSPEHSEAMAMMSTWSGPESRTTNWTSPSREIDWAEANRKLAQTPSYAERQRRGRAGVQIGV
jgi:hypothetical protein